jgi:hypothetical protein
MSAPYPLVNGFRHAWSSIEIRAAGNIIKGVTEINYAPSLEPGIVYAAGAEPIGRTLGQSKYEGDMSILLEEFNDLVTALGDNWMTVSFDVIVSHDASGSGLSVIQDTLRGCRITEVENGSSATSTDATVRKCTLSIMRILMNGVAPGPDTTAPFS